MSLKELEKKYKELGAEIETLKNKPKGIDFTKIPVDTLVEVRSKWSGIVRYFNKMHSGRYLCFNHGGTSNVVTGSSSWTQIRLIRNEPKPWFGGDCPLPDGVRINIWRRNAEQRTDTLPFVAATTWAHRGYDTDIIAYQILESEWQT